MVASPRRGIWALVAILLVVLATAALLRFPALDSLPCGLFRDELEKGYTALQLWHTGRHGIVVANGVRLSPIFPLFIEVFDGHDRTSAIYQYITAPIVGVLGLDGWTTRLAAALSGFLGVVAVGLLGWRLGGVACGVIAAGLVSIHPTGVLFSRWAQQGIIQAALVPAGFWLLLEASRCGPRHRRALSLGAGIVLGVAAYAYDPGRLVIPLFLLAWGIWLMVGTPRRECRERLRPLLPALAVFIPVMALLAFYTLGTGGGRLGRVGLSGSELITGGIRNYLSFWTPNFWLVEGDGNIRHRLPGLGFAGPLVVALLVTAVGVWVRDAIRHRPDWKTHPTALLLCWLLLAPVAAALTREGNPHALRAILLVPASCLLAASLFSRGRMDAILRHRLLLPLLAVAWLGNAALTGWGVVQLSKGPGAPWEAGTVEAVRYALGKGGTPQLSASVPYALYVALFAEATDPARFQEFGINALRTRMVEPDQQPALHPGDSWITPPGRGLPIHFHMSPVVIYERGAEGARVILPPGTEHLYRDETAVP